MRKGYKFTLTTLVVSILLSSCGMLRSADGEIETSGTVTSGVSDFFTTDTGETTAEEPTIMTTETTETTEATEATEATETTAATTTAVSDIDPTVTTESSVAVTEPFVTTITPTPSTEPPITDTPVFTPTDSVTSKGFKITVENGITYVDGTLIANKTYALPESYNPAGLTSETYAAFVEMQSAASSAGHYIFVRSGFRSYIDQRIIYSDYAARDGQDAADRYSARPGHSEHQSGMAIDVNETTYAFGETPAGIWLRENCHKYGFILRYPADKEHITGYMYEPWHIRFVGVELAEKVSASGLTLEEYFGITSAYAE